MTTDPTGTDQPAGDPTDPPDIPGHPEALARPRSSKRTGKELPPPELRALARERSEARRAHDWVEADRLRASIEATGWKVIDKGAEGRIVRAHPEDVAEDDGATRYGWTGSVPAIEVERSTGAITIVARATPEPDDTVRLLSRLIDAPVGTQRLIVADAAAVLPGDLGDRGDRGDLGDLGDVEIIRILAPATAGVALAIALRRARGAIVVVGEGWPAEATVDRIPELTTALADPAVAVAGWSGVTSPDLRHLVPIDPGGGDPVAVAWAGLAFRTTDGLDRAPVDEAFGDPEMLATWWSLVLRDEGPEAAPRRAISLLDATNGRTMPERLDRVSRRDRYRIIDRFGQRYDLLTDPIAADRSRSLHR